MARRKSTGVERVYRKTTFVTVRDKDGKVVVGDDGTALKAPSMHIYEDDRGFTYAVPVADQPEPSSKVTTYAVWNGGIVDIVPANVWDAANRRGRKTKATAPKAQPKATAPKATAPKAQPKARKTTAPKATTTNGKAGDMVNLDDMLAGLKAQVTADVTANVIGVLTRELFAPDGLLNRR